MIIDWFQTSLLQDLCRIMHAGKHAIAFIGNRLKLIDDDHLLRTDKLAFFFFLSKRSATVSPKSIRQMHNNFSETWFMRLGCAW